MNHLTSYKLFEDAGDGKDVFPPYHALSGMEINKVLENILASLPQEEVRHYHKDMEDTYETYVDVDTKNGTVRVCLEVTSGTHSMLSPVFSKILLNKYQVGMRRISFSLFKKIKSIYNDLFKD